MKKKSNRNFWIATIIGLIGAAAWVPQIYDWTLRPNLDCKIISQYHTVGVMKNDTVQGSIIAQKISLFSRHKDFFNKTLQVYLKFPDIEEEIKAKIIVPRQAIFTFNEDGEKVSKRLNINANEHLLHLLVFPKNQSIMGYLLFKLDFKINTNFEYIKYEFQSYTGDKQQLIISSKEIKENELLHDDAIWE